MLLLEYSANSGMLASILPDKISKQLSELALTLDPAADTSHIHLTVAYLGKLSDEDIKKLDPLVKELCAGFELELTAKLGGIGTFLPSNTSDNKYVAYVSIDCPGLELLRVEIIKALYDRGFSIPMDHGFTPHVTLAYVDEDGIAEIDPTELDNDLSWDIEGLTFKVGDKFTNYYKFGVDESIMGDNLSRILIQRVFNGDNIDELFKEITTTGMIAKYPKPMKQLIKNDKSDDDKRNESQYGAGSTGGQPDQSYFRAAASAGSGADQGNNAPTPWDKKVRSAYGNNTPPGSGKSSESLQREATDTSNDTGSSRDLALSVVDPHRLDPSPEWPTPNKKLDKSMPNKPQESITQLIKRVASGKPAIEVLAEALNEADSKYGWIITKDHQKDGSKGKMGPSNISAEMAKKLKAGEGKTFRMRDDDKEVYYEGLFLGDDSSEDGFAPLENFGEPNAGCTDIQYKNGSSWETL